MDYVQVHNNQMIARVFGGTVNVKHLVALMQVMIILISIGVIKEKCNLLSNKMLAQKIIL